MYSLGHGLHTLPAVPRSTQPSALRGTVKWVSAFGSSNNKWRWWMWWWQPFIGGPTVQVLGLVWGLAATRRSVCIHQMNRVNSRSDHGHEDSTINTVIDYYYYYYYCYYYSDFLPWAVQKRLNRSKISTIGHLLLSVVHTVPSSCRWQMVIISSCCDRLHIRQPHRTIRYEHAIWQYR